MRPVRMIRAMTLLGLALAVSGCATSNNSVMRNAPYIDEAQAEAMVAMPQPSVQIVASRVDVPRSLRVSEANSYYPKGDIVWRGDRAGDRYEQVKAIFQESIIESANQIDGQRPAILNVEVHRFHSLTEKARYTTGGVHNIEFSWFLSDAETDIPLTLPQRVRANLDAYGGQAAITAEAHGDTQKVRVTRHLTQVFVDEITSAEGWTQASYGVFDLLNEF